MSNTTGYTYGFSCPTCGKRGKQRSAKWVAMLGLLAHTLRHPSMDMAMHVYMEDDAKMLHAMQSAREAEAGGDEA